MKKKVNIIIGRFQPFTTGHLSCIERVWGEYKTPTIICMIDVAEEKVDNRHPFPSSLLKSIYTDIFHNNPMIEGILLVKNADIVKIGNELYNMGYEINSWVCGTDRFDSYKRMSDKYKAEAHLADSFKLLEVVRDSNDVSSTMLREFLLDDNYEMFSNISPLKNYYDILRSQILKVYK